MTPYHLAGLVIAGLAAGVLNTMAGGGSLFTLPALMWLGMPAGVANGTNRIAVFSQSIFGAWAFYKNGKLDRAALGSILLPTILGTLAGSGLAVWMPEALLKPVLLGTMLLMATLLLLKPDLMAPPAGGQVRSALTWQGFGGLFITGIYGGFIQAGVGFLLLGVFGALLRYDLVRANALKLACTSVFGIVALGIFVAAGQVLWVPGILLAVASMAGSWLGVKLAIKLPSGVIRWVVFVAVSLACVGAYLK